MRSSVPPTSVPQRLVWLQSPGVLILALVLGVLFGIFAPHRIVALDVLVDGYLNFLKILVVPLILCSIILNIQGIRAHLRTYLGCNNKNHQRQGETAEVTDFEAGRNDRFQRLIEVVFQSGVENRDCKTEHDGKNTNFYFISLGQRQKDVVW